MQQNTYCVQKNAQSSFPSRCCPRWTVGCAVGSVGCCDPAQPWQWTINSQPQPTDLASATSANTFVPNADSATAYALITSGWASGDSALFALTIDTGSGNITSKVQVKDFRDDPAGESTRPFLWDSTRKLFYYLDANFTANGGDRPAAGREAFIYSVDPVTGKSQRTTITGATDFPTGFAMSDSGAVLFATENFDEDTTDTTGYKFYSMNPETANAKFLGSNSRGADEKSPSYYSGYHRACSSDGQRVFRLGYEQVTKQIDQGIGVTTLTEKAPSDWKYEPSAGHDFFMSLDRFTANKSDAFVSLAPNRNDTTRGFDVVVWNMDESLYKVAATLGNAHMPRFPDGGDLGYISTVAKGTSFAALVVEYSDAPFDMGDRWALAMVDLDSGKSSVLPLVPRDIAGTWGVSGLGL